MLEIDGRGYIKGTKKLYKNKVVVLQRFSFKGNPVLPTDVIELEGGDLATALVLKHVRLYDPEIDEKQTEAKAEASDSTQVTEKLGPKKTRKKKSE